MEDLTGNADRVFSRECFQLLLSPPELEWVEFDFDTNQTLDNKILKRAADLPSFKWHCHLVFNYCLSITIECVVSLLLYGRSALQ